MPKQKCPDGVPEWVLTFGDMMSLLLCFFIMLFAISTLEVVKAQAVAEAIRSSFGGKRTGQNQRSRSVTARSLQQDITRGGQLTTAPEGENPRVMNIRDMAEPVRGGVIRFEANSDELSEQAKDDLRRLYGLLDGSPYKIEIRGHASPEEQSIHPNSWDLSYTRAMAVKDYLQSLGLPERTFRVSLAGPYEPIGQSSLPAGSDPKSVHAVVEVLQLLDMIRNYQGDATDQQQLYLNQGPL